MKGSAGVMAARLTTNQEVPGSTPGRIVFLSFSNLKTENRV